MPTCRKCKSEIDSLQVRETRNRWFSVRYVGDVDKLERIDTYESSYTYHDFYCPVCHQKLGGSENAAKKLLKGKKTETKW